VILQAGLGWVFAKNFVKKCVLTTVGFGKALVKPRECVPPARLRAKPDPLKARALSSLTAVGGWVIVGNAKLC
jgi:hypothetical protein